MHFGSGAKPLSSAWIQNRVCSTWLCFTLTWLCITWTGLCDTWTQLRFTCSLHGFISTQFCKISLSRLYRVYFLFAIKGVWYSTIICHLVVRIGSSFPEFSQKLWERVKVEGRYSRNFLLILYNRYILKVLPIFAFQTTYNLFWCLKFYIGWLRLASLFCIQLHFIPHGPIFFNLAPNILTQTSSVLLFCRAK